MKVKGKVTIKDKHGNVIDFTPDGIPTKIVIDEDGVEITRDYDPPLNYPQMEWPFQPSFEDYLDKHTVPANQHSWNKWLEKYGWPQSTKPVDYKMTWTSKCTPIEDIQQFRRTYMNEVCEN